MPRPVMKAPRPKPGRVVSRSDGMIHDARRHRSEHSHIKSGAANAGSKWSRRRSALGF